MIIIRPEEASDHAAVHGVVERAFGGAGEAVLVDRLREETGAAIAIVAEVDGVIAGHTLFTPITIGEATPALALAPVAVDPAWQRRGLGRAMIDAGLAAARAQGHAIVVVVGHPEYYPHFGFVPARARGLEVPFPAPDPAFMALELVPGALKGVSGMVRYLPAFSLL